MRTENNDLTRSSGPSWLADVREVRQPLTEQRPIWVRHGIVRTGPPPPRPSVPHPERHPHCEFNLILQNSILQFAEGQQMQRRPGELFLAGPGVPHYGLILAYPYQFATIYFLPTVLFDLGPQADGASILSRFTVRQSLRDRLVRVPPALLRRVKRGFEKRHR